MFNARSGFLSIVLLFFVFTVAANAWAKKPVCGDGICNGSETYETCPEDCDPPPSSECNHDGTCDENETVDGCPNDCFCGNGTCDAGETYDICSADCDPPPPPFCNNNGICNQGEDCLSCPGDCAGVTTGKPSGRYCCGADTCDEGLCGAGCSTPADPICGDGKTDAGEECDDGNITDGDGCDHLCRIETTPEPYCGDGNIDPGETCDDGAETASCDADCTTATCGDGYFNESAGEECDDGVESSYCNPDCTISICGDGYTNTTSGEECDDGAETASCDADCTDATCGDGHLNASAGEECDDGNASAGDGCDPLCLIETPPEPYCGDGNLDPGEECDDGNTTDGDGCDAGCMLEGLMSQVPAYLFNIGDSIGEGEAADGTIGSINHQTVWSTGYDAGDTVNSLNERFESVGSDDYFQNDAASDDIFNRAVSGAVMADFQSQAEEIVAAVRGGPLPANGMIAILLGNNDVCADTLDAMTNPVTFETQYRAGLDVLANNPETKDAHIHVSGIPAIYWLWDAKRSNFWCRLLVWPNVPCQNLLSSPADDCASAASRLDPDDIYPGDGSNCIRRKTFHAKIRDIYNPILRNVLQEYVADGSLPNAEYVDIFDVRFTDAHVNGGDCFHPSEAGHSLLSGKEWCSSKWEDGQFSCEP